MMMKDEQSIFPAAIPSSMISIMPEAIKRTIEEYDEKMMSIRTRKGKWTEEEETYTVKLIEAFIAGVLPLTQGTTLRSFLSDKLCCDPMRITKKFAGSNGIGKHIFSPTMETDKSSEEVAALDREIEKLKNRFFLRIENNFSTSNLSLQQFTSATIAPVEEDVFPLYRIAAPSSSKVESVPSLLDIISSASVRTVAATAVPAKPSNNSVSSVQLPMKVKVPLVEASVPAVRKYTSSSGTSTKVHKTEKEKEKAYVNANYRVSGYEHLAEKEAVKPKKQVGCARTKSLITKTLRDPALKLPKMPILPKRKSKKIVQDTSMDLQASNLLLDFFRAARDKVVSYSESEESGEVMEDNPHSKQHEELNSNTSTGDKVYSDEQEKKKTRVL